MAIRDTAKKMNNLSEVIGEREKVKARDIKERVRIRSVYPISLEGEQEYIIVTDLTYFYAPSSLKRIIEAELNSLNGDFVKLNSQFVNDVICVYFNVKPIKGGKEYIESHLV